MSPTTDEIPVVTVGVEVGGAFPFAPLRAAPWQSLEAGVVLPILGHRVAPFVAASYTAPTASGDEGTWTWDLRMRRADAVVGLRVRALPWSEMVSPEVAAGALVGFTLTEVTSGDAWPPVGENAVGLGAWGAAGVVARVGPGQLDLRLAVSWLEVDGALTGPATLLTLTPSLGFRVLL